MYEDDVSQRNLAFKSIHPISPGRSAFDLSYSKLMTADMGLLYPVQCDEMVPADHFTVGHEATIRFMPMLTPILHQVDVYSFTFFVPYRLLFSEDLGDSGSWEKFITGGVDGQDVSVLPRWVGTDPGVNYDHEAPGTLWDFIGLPLSQPFTSGHEPLDFPRRAYLLIWNEWFRDETQQAKLDIADQSHFGLLSRCWEKGYLESALPFQQRGDSIALPVVGSGSAVWSNDLLGDLFYDVSGETGTSLVGDRSSPQQYIALHGVNTTTESEPVVPRISSTVANGNVLDLTSLSSVNIAEVRVAWQVQKYLERNARGGVRYVEYLHNHFGVTNGDSRLQRPEFVGSTKSPVIISEVLQQSETSTTPQGTMAGHAIGVSSNMNGSYFATEFGLMMTLMCVQPKAVYENNINRQWMRMSRLDFYSPEFAHLSEQAVYEHEVWCDGNPAHQDSIWGYQGRYNEMRSKQNMMVGKMRYVSGSGHLSDSMHYWHLGRVFSGRVGLNSDFLTCAPRKDIFAVTNQPAMVINWGNLIKAIRPLPIMPEPGMVDHD